MKKNTPKDPSLHNFLRGAFKSGFLVLASLRSDGRSCIAALVMLLVGCGKTEPDAPRGSEVPSPTMPLAEEVARKPLIQLPPPDVISRNETAKPSAQAPLSKPALKKLNALLAEALQKTQAASPTEKIDIRTLGIISDGTRVLVDLDAAVSDDLLNHITRAGGQVATTPDAVHTVRVMIPLAQLGPLAAREDVKAITPAHVTVTTGVSVQPAPASGTSKIKP